MHEEERLKKEAALQKQRNISEGLEITNRALELISKNPEVIIDMWMFGKNLVRGISSGVEQIRGGALTLLDKIKQSKKTDEQESNQGFPDIATCMKSDSRCSSLPNLMEMDGEELEDMSIEEARDLAIDTLRHYISMRRNIERLSKTKINDIKNPVLDINQVIMLMDTIIARYPALMDEETSSFIWNMVNQNKELRENRKLLEVLRISDM